MVNKYKAILLFGAPGVGKGTQGKLINDLEGYFHFSSGDMLRSLNHKTDIGIEIKSVIDKGKFVDDDLTIKLFYETIEKHIQQGEYDPTKDYLLLDGIPRTKNQVSLIKDGVEVRQIFYLYCKDSEFIRRIKENRAPLEGREDDKNSQFIKKRIQTYKKETRPL